MSIGVFRGLLTLALFVAFIALWIWAWGKGRSAEYEAASRLPLEDERPIAGRSEQS